MSGVFNNSGFVFRRRIRKKMRFHSGICDNVVTKFKTLRVRSRTDQFYRSASWIRVDSTVRQKIWCHNRLPEIFIRFLFGDFLFERHCELICIRCCVENYRKLCHSYHSVVCRLCCHVSTRCDSVSVDLEVGRNAPVRAGGNWACENSTRATVVFSRQAAAIVAA